MNDETMNLEEMENVIFLEDEEGNEVPFEFVDLIEYEGAEYVILLPVGEELSSEVVILQVDETEDPEEETYSSVDSEETLRAVYERFKEKYQDVFNFLDE